MPVGRLLRRLQLTEVQRNTFVGGAGMGSATVGDRLFGGMVAAQAAVAAYRTIDSFVLHSLHALFLRPGRAGVDIRFEVDRIKEGRNYQARLVTAFQGNDRIFQCQASFARPTSGVEHHADMPDAPAPDECPNRDEARGRSHWRDLPMDIRMCDPITAATALPPRQRVWFRFNGSVPDDDAVQRALLVYASDRLLLDTAWRPHAETGTLKGASLDHGVWIHAPVRMNEWSLYSMHSPAASAGHGYAIGAVYDRKGRRTASVAQEGVLRADS